MLASGWGPDWKSGLNPPDHAFPILRDHRFHCIEKLSVWLFHRDIERMVAYLFDGDHARRIRWRFDFVRLAIPRNGTALVNLLAIGVYAADSQLHFIPHRQIGRASYLE